MTIKRSKGYRKFHTRLLYFRDDIETIEIIDMNKELLAGKGKIFINVDKNFARLSQRGCSSGSRKNVISHLKNSVYISCIKELYEEVILYFGYIFECSALTAPNTQRLIGEQHDVKLTVNEILSFNSREKIIAAVMSQVFRRIENKKNTLLLITTLNERLALGVDNKIIDAAMPYLEARHIFVHADGVADQEYRKKYPTTKITTRGKIYLDSNIIKEFITTIESLVLAFEEKMAQSKYFPNDELE